MKNLLNVEGAKVLSKEAQNSIKGGGLGKQQPPCGGTGFSYVPASRCYVGEFGAQWYNGQCIMCH